MGIHYDYKSKRGERAMLKEAKRKARLAQKRAKRLLASDTNSNKESDWYEACDKIKKRRNGQYPSHLAREILEIYQEKFPAKAD